MADSFPIPFVIQDWIAEAGELAHRWRRRRQDTRVARRRRGRTLHLEPIEERIVPTTLTGLPEPLSASNSTVLTECTLAGTFDTGGGTSEDYPLGVAVLEVDTLEDENDGDYSAGDFSLREAIELANLAPEANTITFAPSLTSAGDATITLTMFDPGTDAGEIGPTALSITSDTTISGPEGDNGIIIRRDPTSNDHFRLLHVTSTGSLTLDHLTLSNGSAIYGPGGAIYSEGILNIQQSTLTGHSAVGGWNDAAAAATVHWTQRGGDAGHTSYVDTSFDEIELAAVWTTPLSGWTLQAVASDGERVFRTDSGSSGHRLLALDIHSGAELWQKALAYQASEGVSAPSVHGTMVYASQAGHSALLSPNLYGLDAVTGAETFVRPYSAQWGSNERPTIADGQLVTESGYYGGMSSYDATTGSEQWFVYKGSSHTRPNAAINNDYVYAFDDEVYDRATGAFVQEIAHPSGWTLSGPMCSTTGHVFFRSSMGVTAFDGDTHNREWDFATPASVSATAVGDGKVAVVAGTTLYMLDEATGTELFHWDAGISLSSELVLTTSHAFVQAKLQRTSHVLHAIDLTLQDSVWSQSYSVERGDTAEMACSDGYLLLSTHAAVTAYAPAGLGGAVFNDGGSLAISNSTLSGNEALHGRGGAVFNRNGSLTIASCTLTENSADQGGRGVYSLADGATASLRIDNSIVAQTDTTATDVESTEINGGTSVTTGVFNLIGSNTGFLGSVVATGAPLLGPLQDTGGPTWTHVPQLGSPVVDEGDPTCTLRIDQRGMVRAWDGDLDGTAMTDIGAVEVQEADLPRDFADAPDAAQSSCSTSYPTMTSENGPRHVAIGPALGTVRDFESDGTHSANADADDSTGDSDDEDSVNDPAGDLSLYVGQTPRIDLTVTGISDVTVTVYGRIDYNGDGVFDNAHERTSALAAGETSDTTLTLVFPEVPSGSVAKTVARFRISTDPDAQQPTGLAADGEVEDHVVTISPATEDFGDAPESAQAGFAGTYPTTLDEDGARHVAIGPMLGAERDAELDGTHSAGADADDLVGAHDDEQGVVFPPVLAFSAGDPSSGRVTIDLRHPSATNWLDAWIDFNRDGDWNDPGEQIFSRCDLGTSAGPQVLEFIIPQDTGPNVASGESYARFRLSTAGGLSPTGWATDGEVEDHVVFLNGFQVDLSVDESDGDYSEGDLSLREAIELANRDPDANTITFDPSLLADGDVTLTLSAFGNEKVSPMVLTVESELTIAGPAGNDGITIQRDPALTSSLQLFHITAQGSPDAQSRYTGGGNRPSDWWCDSQ